MPMTVYESATPENFQGTHVGGHLCDSSAFLFSLRKNIAKILTHCQKNRPTAEMFLPLIAFRGVKKIVQLYRSAMAKFREMAQMGLRRQRR